jgi:hypothetical protein
VKEETDTLVVGILIKVVNSTSVERGGTTDNAVNFITLYVTIRKINYFRKKQFSKIRTVLSSNTGDESDLSVFSGRLRRR